MLAQIDNERCKNVAEIIIFTFVHLLTNSSITANAGSLGMLNPYNNKQ